MAEHTMTDYEKYRAFQHHIRSLGGNPNIFSTRFYHPLQDVFKALEIQLNLDFRGRVDVKPFRFTDDVKALIGSYAAVAHMVQQYEQCFRCLVDCWGKAQDYRTTCSAVHLVQSVKPILDACKWYGCADVGQFPQVIAKGQEDAVRARANALPVLKTGIPVLPRYDAVQAGTRARKLSTVWRADHLRQTYDHVRNTRAGECTSFGHYAAHVLKQEAEAQNMDARIELVVWEGSGRLRGVTRNVERTNLKFGKAKRGKLAKKLIAEKLIAETITVTRPTPRYVTHVFCVVNRRGGTREVGKKFEAATNFRQERTSLRDRLPHFSTWGSDCWVVDPWLASLGYDSAWPVDLYPKKGMLDPLYLEMDSRH